MDYKLTNTGERIYFLYNMEQGTSIVSKHSATEWNYELYHLITWIEQGATRRHG